MIFFMKPAYNLHHCSVHFENLRPALAPWCMAVEPSAAPATFTIACASDSTCTAAVCPVQLGICMAVEPSTVVASTVA
jgi:hypothetical protein